MSPTAVPAKERLTAGERREAVIVAAITEFARGGFEGTSTESIARQAGISQPYLFRLFGTKRELFIATIERCLEETGAIFAAAAEGKSGRDALEAMGTAYIEMITTNPTKLRAQLQAYAACQDDEIRAVVGRGFEALVEMAEKISGEPTQVIAGFFAQGMLLNVLATTGILRSESPWAARLVEGCLTMCNATDSER